GPEEDQESESELTVTQLKALRKQQQAKLEKTMLGEDSDEEENPIAIDFQDVQDAFYMKDPRKALQGFFDREGEELEYEYDDRGHNSWLCRVKLPVDDASGKQLVAEVLHSGKKKEAMVQCALEACRLLDARGVLRQEAVSRKRKSKNWEDEDFYDSDDDTFLDRTGAVEKKRLNRMKKAGKIEEKPETYDSLLLEITEKLKASGKAQSQPAAQDSLDEFMTEIKSGCTLDSVTRKKLHLRSFELRKEQQRLKGLIKLVKPTELPELKPPLEADSKPKKIALPLFGAMKGGSKFKLKTGSLGVSAASQTLVLRYLRLWNLQVATVSSRTEEQACRSERVHGAASSVCQMLFAASSSHSVPSCNQSSGAQLQLKGIDPSRGKMEEEQEPPFFSSHYPDDDPDYCMWVPPAGQSGDGKTHLNEKYGY
uniref:Solute carrier family 4 member 1 adaptor protein n=1 Tax=Anas platyrhynchos TaxID=8839 RepID=A0A8B9SL32_ANAPL